MDIAERHGSLLRLWLRSAERFSECAIDLGSSRENTPESRSSALLVAITCADQRLGWLVLRAEDMRLVASDYPIGTYDNGLMTRVPSRTGRASQGACE